MNAEGQLELRGTPPLGFEARKRNLHLAPLAELKEFRGNTNLDLGYRCVRANAKTAHVAFTCRAHRRCGPLVEAGIPQRSLPTLSTPRRVRIQHFEKSYCLHPPHIILQRQAKRIENGAELRSRPNSGGKHINRG